MTQYKIKIFLQQTGECCKVIPCESHIQQEAKEEYLRVVKEIDLPDENYFSRLFRVKNEEDIQVTGIQSCSIEIKNHQTFIN